ncbi:MAG: phosphotransferase [Planctomycetaceae bacterium]|nr:phosphotransferase [Planctomycetaceae bacterium]
MSDSFVIPPSAEDGETAVVARVAYLFGVMAESVVAASGGFSGAAVYCVQTADNQRYALKQVQDPSPRSLQRLRWQHELINSAVMLRSVPLPQPLSAATGDIRLHSSHLAFDSLSSTLWTAEPWLPGYPADASAISDRHLTNASHALNEIYTAFSDTVLRTGGNERYRIEFNRSNALKTRIEILRSLLNGELEELLKTMEADPDTTFRHLARTICAALSRHIRRLYEQCCELAAREFRLQPVLKDVWSAHVLFTGSDVTGIIDLNASDTDSICCDLSRLQRSWFGSNIGRIQNWVEVFSSIRPLDKPERQLLSALDGCTVLLSPLNWLRRRRDDLEATENQRLHPLGRMLKTVKEPETPGKLLSTPAPGYPITTASARDSLCSSMIIDRLKRLSGVAEAYESVVF